jgi:16S rRNA (guanine527-N7)-methyltransferase
MMIPSPLQEDFKKLQLDMGSVFLSREAWSKLELYLALLSKWSNRINLISQRDLPSIATKHLGQALMMVPVVSSLPNRVILDLGSGAGFPAIPLKVALPDSYFILVESRRKRANFLKEIIRSVGLDRIEVVNDRIEDWGGRQGGVDLITARAVAAPGKMLELVQDYLSPHGWVLTSLSEDTAADLIDLKWRIEKRNFSTTLGLFH